MLFPHPFFLKKKESSDDKSGKEKSQGMHTICSRDDLQRLQGLVPAFQGDIEKSACVYSRHQRAANDKHMPLQKHQCN